jgi:macrolide-specific efflux system membrane fusion protein
MRVKVLAIVLLLVVGGGAVVVALGGFPRSATAATQYLTATAAITNVQDDVAATGAIASTTTWTLAFGAEPTTASTDAATGQNPTGTWRVTDVKAKVGDTVTKGQVLATATNGDLAAAVTAARNDWTVARLNATQAKGAYDDAVDADASDARISAARSTWLTAQNQVASTRRALLDAMAEAKRDRLIAPVAGIVTAVDVAAGQDAPAGAAITIATTDYAVTADVVESDITSLKIGQPASVEVAALGTTLDGTVSAIAPTAASSSGNGSVVSFAVRVSLGNPPATLRAGMTADVTIVTASASDVLAVPAAAVRGANGNYTVLVMNASGTPEARPVTVGLMTSSLVEIRSGLSEGETVVTGTSSAQRSTTSNGFGGPNGGFVQGAGGGRGGGPVFETRP